MSRDHLLPLTTIYLDVALFRRASVRAQQARDRGTRCPAAAVDISLEFLPRRTEMLTLSDAALSCVIR